jgi:hypothetical protein
MTNPNGKLPAPMQVALLHGPYFLALLSLLLVAAGLFAHETDAVSITSIVLGGLLGAFSAVAVRIEGPVEMSKDSWKATLIGARLGSHRPDPRRCRAEGHRDSPAGVGRDRADHDGARAPHLGPIRRLVRRADQRLVHRDTDHVH